MMLKKVTQRRGEHIEQDKTACVLGIDPGLHITGYAVVERSASRPILREAGVIRTVESKSGMAARLLCLYNGLVEVIEQYRPAVLAVEQLYAHYKHPRTAILMGHARGVVLLAASAAGLEVNSYSATQVKKTITGSGRASKEQMQRAIQNEMGLAKLPDPPDVADALAVALCHCYAQTYHRAAHAVSDDCR
ncbi:MAG: crossover junction endodeoxyribonuclease RuvC [Gemmataceae bacterium]|nr:crossover junction endodeoxyribonuclease RuvC [Gemmataceae bacterium]MCI0741763.1 crossover junction endodeoxyribonuclease RuvC [Gemmataceae bacterium]